MEEASILFKTFVSLLLQLILQKRTECNENIKCGTGLIKEISIHVLFPAPKALATIICLNFQVSVYLPPLETFLNLNRYLLLEWMNKRMGECMNK